MRDVKVLRHTELDWLVRVFVIERENHICIGF